MTNTIHDRVADTATESQTRELTDEEIAGIAGGNILNMMTQVLAMSHEGKKSVIQNLRA